MVASFVRFPILFPYLTLTFSSLYSFFFFFFFFATLVPILLDFYSTLTGFSSLEGNSDSFISTRG